MGILDFFRRKKSTQQDTDDHPADYDTDYRDDIVGSEESGDSGDAGSDDGGSDDSSSDD